MRKLSTLTLTGVGTNALLERGKLELGKGRVMRGIRLIMKFLVNNASGASVTLSDAQRQDFLNGYRLTLSYGRSGRRKPFNAMRFGRVQRIARAMVGSDWEGYSGADPETGFGRSFPHAPGSGQAVQLNVVIPCGYFWQLGLQGKVFGIGRTQAKTMQVEVKRDADVLPSGVTVSGPVTFEVVPDEASRSGPDQWWYMHEWLEQDETDKVARLPAGSPLYFAERTQPLWESRTVVTDFALHCDGEELHRGVSALEAYRQALYDIPNVPGEADLADRETPLLVVTPGTELRDLLSGALRFEQITKTLSTAALGLLNIPIPTETEVREDVQDAAGKNGRNKTLRAVNAAVALGLELPHHLYPYMPFYLYDADDKEFERFPGLVSDGSAPADIFIPSSVLDRVRGTIALYRSNGEEKQAEDLIRTVALAVPGVVQDTRGFSRRGSEGLNQVRATIEG